MACMPLHRADALHDVPSVTFMSQGREFIVTGSLDQQLKVWDASNGDLIFTKECHAKVRYTYARQTLLSARKQYALLLR